MYEAEIPRDVTASRMLQSMQILSILKTSACAPAVINSSCVIIISNSFSHLSVSRSIGISMYDKSSIIFLRITLFGQKKTDVETVCLSVAVI